MNRFFLVGMQDNTREEEFVVANAKDVNDAAEQAVRRAKRLGWGNPTVQTVAEHLLTSRNMPEIPS